MDPGGGATVQRLESGAVISRKGNPSFTAIQRISFGIVNVGSTTVVERQRLGRRAQVDLRQAGHRESPTASSVGLGLADLGAINLGYQRVDANFLRIGSERGDGTTKTDLNLSTRVNADKFLERWGVRLPITVTVGRGKQVPKFRTNSDLVLDKPRPSDITETANNDSVVQLLEEPLGKSMAEVLDRCRQRLRAHVEDGDHDPRSARYNL